MSDTLLSDLNFVISVNGDVHPQANLSMARRVRDELISLRRVNAGLVAAVREAIDIIDQGDTSQVWNTALLKLRIALAAADAEKGGPL